MFCERRSAVTMIGSSSLPLLWSLAVAGAAPFWAFAGPFTAAIETRHAVKNQIDLFIKTPRMDIAISKVLNAVCDPVFFLIF